MGEKPVVPSRASKNNALAQPGFLSVHLERWLRDLGRIALSLFLSPPHTRLGDPPPPASPGAPALQGNSICQHLAIPRGLQSSPRGLTLRSELLGAWRLCQATLVISLCL